MALDEYPRDPVIRTLIRVVIAREVTLPPELGEDLGQHLLWVLAMEIDDRRVTLTGESVCRACGGRGAVDEWIPRRIVHTGRRRFKSVPCPCDGDTRPVSVLLAWEVRLRARGWAAGLDPRPVPGRWAIDADWMEARGWTGGEAPNAGEVGELECLWWRSFMGWAASGRVEHVGALHRLLVELLPGIEERGRAAAEKRARWRRVRDAGYRGVVTLADYRALLLDIEDIEDVLVYDSGNWPLEVAPATVFVSWRGSASEQAVRTAVDPAMSATVSLEVVEWVDNAHALAWSEALLIQVIRANPSWADDWQPQDLEFGCGVREESTCSWRNSRGDRLSARGTPAGQGRVVLVENSIELEIPQAEETYLGGGPRL